MHFCAFTGFFLGAKVCDYFFYDETPFVILREEIEDEYWAKYG